MHRDIIEQQDMLNHLFEQAKLLQDKSEIDNEIKVQFVWYLCIRASSYVEFSVRRILLEYVKLEANRAPYLANFVNKKLDHSFNPKPSKILELVELFSTEWKQNLGSSIDGKLSSSLGSIVANRNRIAHGEISDITYARLSDFYTDAQEVVRLMYEVCNNRNVENP
ncbi:MAG: MAE_28990/MAE_18760 family HEPN-like nuclease [Chloroflexota bacterium]|nr:MAE_28990/MAE_18760 family HEPN-like nuclease [Chloroflexota bacterium]MDE2946069.1 MAE_28990/MAE_18760 family HEPN-like nuclease [Chloroflexota bacterium]